MALPLGQIDFRAKMQPESKWHGRPGLVSRYPHLKYQGFVGVPKHGCRRYINASIELADTLDLQYGN